MSILDDLYAAMESVKPVQHYATADDIPRGKAFRIASDGFYPDLWVFHPDDFAARRAELAQHCRLVDFHEWKATDEQIAQLWQKVLEQMRSAPPRAAGDARQ